MPVVVDKHITVVYEIMKQHWVRVLVVGEHTEWLLGMTTPGGTGKTGRQKRTNSEYLQDSHCNFH